MLGVKRFRWWHGCVMGLLLGTALWWADGALEGSGPPRVVTALGIGQFVRFVSAGAMPGAQPQFERLTIHPLAEGRNVVTGRAVVENWNGASDQSFEFLAPVPFVVQGPAVRRSGLSALFGGGSTPAAPKTYADVRAYLAAVAPSLSYRYAWWEAPRARAGLWVGGPTVALGVLLPGVLALLVRAGLMARPVEEPVEVAAPLLGGEEPKPEGPVVDQAAVAAQLDAVIENAERRLGEVADVASPAGGTAAVQDAPIRKLTGSEDAVPAAAGTVEEKNFDKGEYYPVSRGKADTH